MTLETFRAYQDVQQTGITNMWDVDRVIEIAKMQGHELTESDCLDIIRNYATYQAKYKDL